MNENLQTSSVTWVWKPDVDSNSKVHRILQMLWQTCPECMLRLKGLRLETHTDGFGRRYVTLEVPLPPLSSTDAIEKSGSLSYARKTLFGLSDHLPKDLSTHDRNSSCTD